MGIGIPTPEAKEKRPKWRKGKVFFVKVARNREYRFESYTSNNPENPVRLRGPPQNMVLLVQLIRTSDCGSEGREFEPHMAP